MAMFKDISSLKTLAGNYFRTSDIIVFTPDKWGARTDAILQAWNIKHGSLVRQETVWELMDEMLRW
jgi:hypothetical protein